MFKLVICLWVMALLGQGMNAAHLENGLQKPESTSSCSGMKEVFGILETMQSQISDLKAEYIKVTAEITHVKAENDILKETNQDLTAQIRHLEASHTGIIAYNSVFENRLNAFESELNNVKVLQNTFVAFTAFATEDRNYDANERVMFEGIVTNYGDHYNPLLGVFICPTNGYYLFSVHYVSDSTRLWTSLRLNGTDVVTIYNNESFEPASNSVVIHCEPEQIVDVVCQSDGAEINGGSGSNERWSTFSGALLQIIVS